MELLCGVPKPQRRSGWGSGWGRASTGKGATAKGDLNRGWGSIRRSATMPSSGSYLSKSSRSSPQAYRRHLLPSTLPSASKPQRAATDPYKEPLCPAVTLTSASKDVVVVDDVGEPGTLRRSQTLPIGVMRKPPTCLSSAVASLKREGSLRRRGASGRDTIKKNNNPPKEGLKRQGSASSLTTTTQANDKSVSERTVDSSVVSEPVVASTQDNVDSSAGTPSPFRRTLTLPPGAICRRCPGMRTPERRKISFVHSKTDPTESDEKESSDTIVDMSDATSDGTRTSSSWRGKRNSTTSTMSGLSRLTSTTTTDEGVCVYSEGGSVGSSSMYGSVRGGAWSGSSVDEGISVYSAPSLASSADLSSASSLYERAGARPKLRTPQVLQGILQKKEGQEEEDEKCLRCQREAAGGSSTPLRRARSLRTPRHLPVTPTLLRLLQLVSVTLPVSVFVTPGEGSSGVNVSVDLPFTSPLPQSLCDISVAPSDQTGELEALSVPRWRSCDAAYTYRTYKC
ncbi:uncharacterized serine-rich protein C215.13-like [Homarus americanus]|uniref:uncharacterized serine-rich protein C215.13-like n=1 Tax=Homarus americanus TaxID=6706 RepID=UPI001C489510|nr:uncharacterized serine-rich protein C215.13-like [Homarus americanus]